MEQDIFLLWEHCADSCGKENIKETNIALPFPVGKVVRPEGVLSKEEMDLFMLDNDRMNKTENCDAMYCCLCKES